MVGKDGMERVYGCAGGRERDQPSFLRGEAVSHWSKGMAFAQWLILLRVESLPLQVDLAEL